MGGVAASRRRVELEVGPENKFKPIGAANREKKNVRNRAAGSVLYIFLSLFEIPFGLNFPSRFAVPESSSILNR